MGVKIYGIIVTLLVASATIAGLIIIGSPLTERERRFDDQRVNDLQQISSAIDLFYTKTGHLPRSLNELVKPEVARLYNLSSTIDPKTSITYEYSTTTESSYKLCANFTQANTETSGTQRRTLLRNHYPDNNAWEHPAGHKCIELFAPPLKANRH